MSHFFDLDRARDAGAARASARRRRIVIWGINYAPEPTGIAPYTTDLARHLGASGAEVTVLTGFPYYPAWRKAPADQGQLYRTEQDDEVTVLRCWQHVPRRQGTLGRVLHEASFALTSFLRALFLPRADLYVVVSPPLGLGPAAWLLTRLRRSRYFFHVQDLQPDSAAGVGLMRRGLFLRLMYAAERFAYRGAAGIGAISPGMADALREKGVPPEKIFLLPNWARARRCVGAENAAADFRRRHAIPVDTLLAVYSGNLGRKQGLDVLPAAAEQLAARPAPTRVMILVAGDGAGRAELESRAAAVGDANFRLLPLLAEDDYQAMLAATDVALITQLPGTGRFCFPSKLLSVLCAGRPVIAVADESSDLARAVASGGFGRTVPAGDAVQLAAALREAAADPARLRAWAQRTDWAERFSPDVLLPRFEAAIHTLADGATTVPPSSMPGELPLS